MARAYTKTKRADQQAETRRRIVEAAVELHGTIGPSRTSMAMLAEHAGVQRHTLYAHFPDQRSLGMACSGLAYERDPPPEAAPWREIGERSKRLQIGLRAIYAWYGRNAQLLGLVLRDAETDPLIAEISQLRFGPAIGGYHEVLGAGLDAKQRAMLGLALSFFTWRTLTLEGGLKLAAAAAAMAQAIECAGKGG
jgi:AcrR family transcriptional regulator